MAAVTKSRLRISAANELSVELADGQRYADPSDLAARALPGCRHA
jgi:hypothetical protein